MEGQSATAASAYSFSGKAAPLRHDPSQVISALHSASWIRSLSASELNPPNTTECGAPIRAHARRAVGSSGTIPM